MYKNKTLERYFEDLSARSPAPGGGSAAACAAGLAASLMSMVIKFTLGKSSYRAYAERLSELLEQTEKLRSDFLRLVDLDVTAYTSGNIRSCMDVPLMTARLCFEAVKICPVLASKGNKNLASDVAVAAQLLEASFAASCCNVNINLSSLKDTVLSRKVRAELSAKTRKIRVIRQRTEAAVGKIIRG
jgi:formiminotetrahydrofolate cyclodeaminase